MQHIGISLMDERCNIVEKTNINFAIVANEFWEIKNCEQKYPFLAGVDPYGDTYFNVRQIIKVIQELKELKQENLQETTIIEISNTIEFLKKVEQHTFAKFIGD